MKCYEVVYVITMYYNLESVHVIEVVFGNEMEKGSRTVM